MPNKSKGYAPQIDTKTATIIDAITGKYQTYYFLIFEKGEGPNYAETLAIAKEVRSHELEIPSLDDIKKICDKDKSDHTFSRILEPGVWGYVLDLNLKTKAMVATFSCSDRYDGRVGWGYSNPDEPARMLIFRCTYPFVAQLPQDPVDAGLIASGEKILSSAAKFAAMNLLPNANFNADMESFIAAIDTTKLPKNKKERIKKLLRKMKV